MQSSVVWTFSKTNWMKTLTSLLPLSLHPAQELQWPRCCWWQKNEMAVITDKKEWFQNKSWHYKKTTWLLKVGVAFGNVRWHMISEVNRVAPPGPVTPQDRRVAFVCSLWWRFQKWATIKNSNSNVLKKKYQGNHSSMRSSLSLTVPHGLFFSNKKKKKGFKRQLRASYDREPASYVRSPAFNPQHPHMSKRKKCIKLTNVTHHNLNGQVSH